MTLPSIGVAGTGPVAHALARGYTDAGGEVACVVSRDVGRAAATAARVGARRGSARLEDLVGVDVLLVAVSDSAVARLGARLGAVSALAGVPTLHTSGALAASELGLERAGSLHPLQSFSWPRSDVSDPAGHLAARLPDVHWFHEGAGADQARTLVTTWAGVFHALAPGAKSLYHAGAAVLSNHSVALFAAALRLFGAAGIPPDEAVEPLARLFAGTQRNLEQIGLPGALTGPISRGDAATVAAHLDAISAATPDLLASYVELALLAVDVAVEKGTISAAGADELRVLLASR